MSKKVFVFLCIFILSRLIFINPLPVFFDSPEYLSRLSNPNYFQTIISGHMPFHAGYIILFWPIFQFAKILSINPSFAVIFAQIIFSAISIYLFYRFVEIISNKKIAFIATIISALLPFYWIMNVSIMVESTYINFFIISLFSLAQFVKRKTKANLYLLVGCVSFGLALLTNPLIILWTPFLLSVIYFFGRKKIIPILLSMILTVFIIILVNSFLVAYALHVPLQNGIHQYLFGEDIKIAPNISSPIMILRFIRNALVPSLQNNTVIIFILSIISLIGIFKKNIKLFIVTFLWISPSIITNQWFDSLLYGRHGTIAVFGFALITAIFLEKRKKLFFIVLIYILLVSLPALNLLRQPIPYIEMGEFIKTLPKGLLIESHFARPQVEGHYSGEIMYANQPGYGREKLEKAIDSYLGNKKPVFVTSQALSDPYGVYFGPFLYSLSLSYARKFELEDLLSLYSLSDYAVIDKNANIAIFKIVSKEKSIYPEIPKLNYNKHRIDYFDPMVQLWFLIDKADIIHNQSIIKE